MKKNEVPVRYVSSQTEPVKFKNWTLLPSAVQTFGSENHNKSLQKKSDLTKWSP